jgi:hypothetical protein
VEGKAFEKLVGVLYEERSPKGGGEFPLSEGSTLLGRASVFPLFRRCPRTSGKRSNAGARSCKIWNELTAGV